MWVAAVQLPGQIKTIRPFETWQQGEAWLKERGFLPFSHPKGREENYVYWDRTAMKWDYHQVARLVEIKQGDEQCLHS